MLAHYGDGLGAFQDSGDIHCAENSAGRRRSHVYLCHSRTLLRTEFCAVEYGYEASRGSFGAPLEAHCAMLSQTVGAPAVRFVYLTTSSVASHSKHVLFFNIDLLNRAREALRQCLPDALKDQTFAAAIQSEDAVQRWLTLLLKNLNDPAAPAATGAAAPTASAASAAGGAARTAAVNLPSIPSGSSGAFGYASVPLASANWNT